MSQTALPHGHHHSLQLALGLGIYRLRDVKVIGNTVKVMAVVCDGYGGQSLCRLRDYKVFKDLRHGLARVSIHCDFSGHILDLMPFAKICVEA